MNNCEIVIHRPVAVGDENNANIATFIPAEKFLLSVFDDEPGHMSEINGQPIHALMCKRASIVPVQTDDLLIRTKVPFFLSSDFDAPGSPLLSVWPGKYSYQYSYSGPELNADDAAALKQFMEELNGK